MQATTSIGTETAALRAFHASGKTRPQAFRRAALEALERALRQHEEALLSAMHADMHKPRFEAYTSDVALVYAEISHTLRHLSEWMAVEHVSTPLAIQPATSGIHREPLGVVLIIAPWNYPALLLLSPLVGAIAAGNCVVVKPSNETPRTTEVIVRILSEAFASDHVSVVQGPGSTTVPPLLERNRFDHIFFTGSAAVGAQVMALAAPRLTPVTLELGGKSPAIVDRKVDLRKAAERIAWSKYFNAGQTCIAADHALVHRSVMEPFLKALEASIRKFYGPDPKRSPDLARMINADRFTKVKNYLRHGQVRIGGTHDEADRYIAPTVLTDVPLESPPMVEEIFGPVLPVIPWTDREEVLAIVERNPSPLAAYIYSEDKRVQRYFTERIAFGGGCVNHGMLHFGNPELAFGGVGQSGMGSYHGRRTFELFSHRKSMVHAATWIEHGLQSPPYTSLKERIVRWVLK